MSKYIILLNWTEQGIKAIKESADRYDASKQLAQSLGCTLDSIHLTFGKYDMIIMLEAPSDEAAATFVLRLASGGNVRGQTLKAFPEADYRRIISGL